MSTLHKRITLIVCTFLFLGVIAHIGITMLRNAERQRELEAVMEAERIAQREIVDAYVRVNYAFAIWTTIMHGEEVYSVSGIYRPLPDVMSSQNPFGVCSILYLLLRMYYHRVGVVLEYEKVVDYFSQEFESDGSLRLYNNGKHSEIEAFVTWM